MIDLAHQETPNVQGTISFNFQHTHYKATSLYIVYFVILGHLIKSNNITIPSRIFSPQTKHEHFFCYDLIDCLQPCHPFIASATSSLLGCCLLLLCYYVTTIGSLHWRNINQCLYLGFQNQLLQKKTDSKTKYTLNRTKNNYLSQRPNPKCFSDF